MKPKIFINGRRHHAARPVVIPNVSALENAKRIALIIAPPNPDHADRAHCRCVQCSMHLHQQWTYLRAVHKWTQTKIARHFLCVPATVDNGVKRVAGLPRRLGKHTKTGKPRGRPRGIRHRAKLHTRDMVLWDNLGVSNAG